MGELMQICIGKLQFFGLTWSLPNEKIRLVISHAAHIFHSSIIVFWDKYLVVFSKRVRLTKKLRIKRDTCFGNFEHLLVIHMAD